MAVIEKLVCEAAGEDHISDGLDWLENPANFPSVDADRVDWLRRVYNSNKHRRQQLTERREKEPETRIQDYLDSGDLERRDVDPPEDEDRSISDQPSHYALFELECECVIEQMIAVVDESPNASVVDAESRPFRRRSVVFSGT